jgi:serine/threonine protein kinase
MSDLTGKRKRAALSPLGAGGMGEVWKARDTRLNRIVAIKRLAAPYSDRFDQEARAIATLNHPHICQIHDVGQGYLILEYIEGRRLQGPRQPTRRFASPFKLPVRWNTPMAAASSIAI